MCNPDQHFDCHWCSCYSLLKTPDLLHRCAKAMVEAAGPGAVISVKMRTGFDDTSLFEDNLLAAQVCSYYAVSYYSCSAHMRAPYCSYCCYCCMLFSLACSGWLHHDHFIAVCRFAHVCRAAACVLHDQIQSTCLLAFHAVMAFRGQLWYATLCFWLVGRTMLVMHNAARFS